MISGAGPVEFKGAIDIDTSDATTVEFKGTGVKYGSDNEWAVVLSQWSETQRYHCVNSSWPFGGTPSCTEDGVFWGPIRVAGYDQRVSPFADDALWHDRLCPTCLEDIDRYCVEMYPAGQKVTHGEEVERRYDIGLDLHGSIYNIPVHASAKYTRQSTDAKTTVYAYTAVHPETPRHYLFTHIPIPSDKSASGANPCPSANAGDIWTTTDDVTTAIPDESKQVADTTNKTLDSGTANRVQEAGRCRYEPDDCRPTG